MSASAAPAPPVDCYVVLDFEAAFNKADGPDKVMEVIELPSVVIDARTGAVLSEFQQYVRPVIYPQMHPLVTEITKITQDTVNKAQPFPVAFQQYREWLAANRLSPLPPQSLPITADRPAADKCLPPPNSRSFCFVTCGDWDIKTMLPAQYANCGGVHKLVAGSPNADAHAKLCEALSAQWCNLKDVFNNSVGGGGRDRVRGMTGMLEKLGLPLIGQHHSGIDDCRNIAAVLRVLLQRGVRVDVTNTRACVGGALPNRHRFDMICTPAAARMPGRLPQFHGDMNAPFATSILADRKPQPQQQQQPAAQAQPSSGSQQAASPATAAATAPAGPPGAVLAGGGSGKAKKKKTGRLQ